MAIKKFQLWARESDLGPISYEVSDPDNNYHGEDYGWAFIGMIECCIDKKVVQQKVVNAGIAMRVKKRENLLAQLEELQDLAAESRRNIVHIVKPS